MCEGLLVLISGQKCCFRTCLELRLRRKHSLSIALCGAASVTIGSQSSSLLSDSWLLPPKSDEDPTLLAASLHSGFFILLASKDFIFHYKPRHIFKDMVYIYLTLVFLPGILC